MQRVKIDESVSDVMSPSFFDDYEQNGAHASGAELRPPPFSEAFSARFYVPFVCYVIFFQVVSLVVKRLTWKSFEGFRQYRLRNLSICLMHSAISGTGALIFSLAHSEQMLQETMHWYEPWATHLVMFSMAYFVHDLIDMVQYENSRWILELFLHHFASVFVLANAVFPQKFLLYAYWALLMEVNSIFLHCRTISLLSGFAERHPRVFFWIRLANISTFVIFRFCVQIWQIQWVWRVRDLIHGYYFCVGFYGGLFFVGINGFLFVRVLAADGWLGDYGRKHAAINRDDQRFKSKEGNAKSE